MSTLVGVHSRWPPSPPMHKGPDALGWVPEPTRRQKDEAKEWSRRRQQAPAPAAVWALSPRKPAGHAHVTNVRSPSPISASTFCPEGRPAGRPLGSLWGADGAKTPVAAEAYDVTYASQPPSSPRGLRLPRPRANVDDDGKDWTAIAAMGRRYKGSSIPLPAEIAERIAQLNLSPRAASTHKHSLGAATVLPGPFNALSPRPYNPLLPHSMPHEAYGVRGRNGEVVPPPLPPQPRRPDLPWPLDRANHRGDAARPDERWAEDFPEHGRFVAPPPGEPHEGLPRGKGALGNHSTDLALLGVQNDSANEIRPRLASQA